MSETPGAGEGAPEGVRASGALAGLDRAGAWVDRVSERVSWELFRLGIYVAIPALVVLVSTDVTLRYVFNAPLQWARDVNGLLLLTSIFCSLPHAWDRGYHIRMEIFYNRVARPRRRGLDVLAAVAGIVFFGFMAVLAFCSLVMVLRLFANPAADEHRLRYGVTAPGSAAVQSEEGV